MGWRLATVLGTGWLLVALGTVSRAAEASSGGPDRPLIDELRRLEGAAESKERRKAAEGLRVRLGAGGLNPEERKAVTDGLIRALEDQAAEVRQEAAGSFAGLDHPTSEALTALRWAARNSDGQVRVEANLTLWRVASDKTAVLALKSVLKDAAPAVRAAAAGALTWPGLGTPDDIADLIPMLQDPDANTRGSAAAATMVICANSRGKAKGAVPALVKAIRHDDPIVRFRMGLTKGV
jgi:HEAT repeat protein